MYCSNCGTQVSDDSRFCHNCGHNLQQSNNNDFSEQNENIDEAHEENKSQDSESNTNENHNSGHDNKASQDHQNQTPPNPTENNFNSFEVFDKKTDNNESLNLVLKIFCTIFAVVFAFQGLANLFSVIVNLDSYAYTLRFSPFFIFTLPLSFLSGLVYILTALILVVFAFKRTTKNSTELFLGLAISCALCVLMVIIRQFFNLAIFGIMAHGTFFSLILPIICAFGAFVLLHVMNQSPDFGRFAQNTGDKILNIIRSIKDAFCELISSSSHSSQSTNQNNQNYNQYNTGYNMNNQDNNFSQPQYNIPSTPLKQDRNILVFIVLNIITCGIYGLYTIYSLANDVNIACREDGRTTSGLLIFILLSIVTCGIYSFYWYYSIANRISANGPRYGMTFQEDGTSILLWMILGSLLCGVGYWIAYHIIFKNMNALAAAYNNRRF